jgi:hypothetical protein
MTLSLEYDRTISCIVINLDKAFISNEVKVANMLNPEMVCDP